MGLEGRWAAIRERLAWFAENDSATTVFGAVQHRWQLDAPLSEEALAAFESEQGGTLPPGYRAFLQYVGNGGAGPYYGLSPLTPLERDTMPSHHVVAKDAEGNVLAQQNAISMALWAERHHPGIDECVRLLDAALEEKPEWGEGWRMRGYVHPPKPTPGSPKRTSGPRPRRSSARSI